LVVGAAAVFLTEGSEPFAASRFALCRPPAARGWAFRPRIAIRVGLGSHMESKATRTAHSPPNPHFCDGVGHVDGAYRRQRARDRLGALTSAPNRPPLGAGGRHKAKRDANP